jgi:hypothetical protein
MPRDQRTEGEHTAQMDRQTDHSTTNPATFTTTAMLHLTPLLLFIDRHIEVLLLTIKVVDLSFDRSVGI